MRVLISIELCPEIKKSVIVVCFAPVDMLLRDEYQTEDVHTVRMVNDYGSENNIQDWAGRMVVCEPLSSFTSARSRDWIVSNLEAISSERLYRP